MEVARGSAASATALDKPHGKLSRPQRLRFWQKYNLQPPPGLGCRGSQGNSAWSVMAGVEVEKGFIDPYPAAAVGSSALVAPGHWRAIRGVDLKKVGNALLGQKKLR